LAAFHQSTGKVAYACSVSRHLSRDQGHVDAFVLAEVKARAEQITLDVPEWVDEEDAQIREQISALEARKHDAASRYAEGLLDLDMLHRASQEIDGRIADLQAKQTDAAVVDSFDAVRFGLDALDRMTVDH